MLSPITNNFLYKRNLMLLRLFKRNLLCLDCHKISLDQAKIPIFVSDMALITQPQLQDAFPATYLKLSGHILSIMDNSLTYCKNPPPMTSYSGSREPMPCIKQIYFANNTSYPRHPSLVQHLLVFVTSATLIYKCYHPLST